jgi:uncharacterized membrane protein YkvA (DUF1232 family)
MMRPCWLDGFTLPEGSATGPVRQRKQESWWQWVTEPVTGRKGLGMWGSWWQDLLLGLAAGLLLAWAALIAALVIARPRGGLLREALRLLPDLLRLLPRLAADRRLPRRARVALALLLAFLAFPFDLIPDFIPVLGYADDAIIVAAVLRWVVRQAGVQAIRRQWPGTDDGFAALCRITGLAPRQAVRPAARPPAREP